MIEHLICSNCFSFWFLFFVILFIGLYYFGVTYLADKEPIRQNELLEKGTLKIMTIPVEEFMDRIMKTEGIKLAAKLKEKEGNKDWLPEDPELYILEMSRRLIIQFKRFNTTTNIFSIALIILAVVQIVLLIFD